MRTRRRAAQPGYSLIEVSIAVLAVAVVAAMGFNALQTVRKRSAFASATGDLLVALKRARNEAFGLGAPVVVMFHTSGKFQVFVDDGDFTVATPNVPLGANDKLLVKSEVKDPVFVGPADGHGLALPRPYSLVPANRACTICDSNGYGAIVFHGNGTAALSGANPDAGSITLHQQGAARRKTYAIIARTGAVNVFER